MCSLQPGAPRGKSQSCGAMVDVLLPSGGLDGSFSGHAEALSPMMDSCSVHHLSAVEVDTEIEESETEDCASACLIEEIDEIGESQDADLDDDGASARTIGDANEVEEEDVQSLCHEDDGDDFAESQEGSQIAEASSSAADAKTDSSTSGDYVVPEANKQVWKQFGFDTEAGRALRRLYQGRGQSDGASMVSYPRLRSPQQRWEAKPAPRKACPQRAQVRVPKARGPRIDPDDPRHWRLPLPGRKPAAEILAEMEAAQPQVPNLPVGRNQAVEKQHLQDRFQFCGGRAMPKGAMGHVNDTLTLPKPAPSIRAMLEDRSRIDDNGMNAEEREIFQELVLAVQRKQERLKEIDEENSADGKPGKAKTARNKEALELQNDIERCLGNIDTLLHCTENQDGSACP